MNRKKKRRHSFKYFFSAAILVSGIVGLLLLVFVQTRRLSYYVTLPENGQEISVLPLDSFETLHSLENESRSFDRVKKTSPINHQNFNKNNNYHDNIINNINNNFTESVNKYRYCGENSDFTLAVLTQWENEASPVPELAAAKEFLSEFQSESPFNETNAERTLPCFVPLENIAIVWDRLNCFSDPESLRNFDNLSKTDNLNLKDNLNTTSSIGTTSNLNIIDNLNIKKNLDKKYSFMHNPLNRILFFAPNEVRLDCSPPVRLLKRAGTICLTPAFLILLITLAIGAPGLHVLCPIGDALLLLLIFWEKLRARTLRFILLIVSPNFQSLPDRVKSDFLTNLFLSNIKTIRLLI